MTQTQNDVKNLVFIAGVIVTMIGLLWIGQGTGWVKWPASSFMIAQQQWVYYGACAAFVGLFLMGFGRARR